MTDEYEFRQPSEKATSLEVATFKVKHNFPFDNLPIGLSFAVPADRIKSVEALRTLASRKGKELKKKFRVIDHKSEFEVFRVE